MALNDRSDQVVRAFVRSDLPDNIKIDADFKKYLTGEFDLIQQVLSEANDSSPQVAEAAPASVRKGMVRYAVAPWDPLGTGFSGYVTYNGSAWVKGMGITYAASDISSTAHGTTAATDVQTAINELSDEKLSVDHSNLMTAAVGFSQLNTTPAAVEGFQWAPFIYVTTPAAESIGVTGKTKTAGGALTTVMELSDSVYFYDRAFPVYLQWTDAGATAGPNFTLQRFSSSPAAADQIGTIRFEGKDSTNVMTLYANITGQIDSPTDTAEQGSIGFFARNGGAASTEQARIGYNGVTVGSPTGGMKGAGTINVATEFYKNGTALAIGGKLLRKTIYNTNAGSPFTWSLGADVGYIVVECVGGGGGGGAATAGAAASSAYGGGGGAGAYSRKLVARAALGATETVTIAAAAASAANGGTCSFGTHVSSGGGLAGASFALSAAAAVGGALGGGGGTATAGDEQYAGACGATALRLSALAGFNGAGAPSVWGGGGAAIANGNAIGNAGTAPGSGGAGGSGSNTGTARAGGAGAVGQVIVWEYS
jgi:hypothetical protein